MRKLFTFLVAFLATVSGTVWGQGSADSPIELGKDSPTLKITDSSETWYITTKPGETNTAGIRIDGGSPTIHLIDVNMSAGGSSIVLEGYTTATFVLEGISSITSQNGTDAAIKVGTDSQLNISIESTGILTINTPNSNNYAIGGRGIASVGSGTVYFDGGTIMTNGIIGDFEWHGMRLNNSAVLIANAVTGSRGNTSGLEDGGVKFIGGTTAGEIVDAATEFTLNSPVPDGYSINMKNKPFTAGKGAVINKNMVLNASQINAYQISYDPNYQEGDAGGSTQQSINYFGPSTTVRNILDLECKGIPQTHQFLGWVDSDGTIHTNQTYTTSSTEPSGVQTLYLTGGWIDLNKKFTITSAGWQESTLLLTPGNAKASFEESTSSPLPDDLNINPSTRLISGTWNETEDKEATINVKINGSTDVYKTVKLTFDYAADITITGAKVKDNVTYAGAPLKDAIEVTAVDGENNPVTVTLGVHYTISAYTYEQRIFGTSVANPSDDPEIGKVIQQAGTYKGIKIAAKPGKGVTLDFDGNVTDPLIVKPYSININVPTNQTALEGEAIDINYSLPETVHGKTPKTNDGKLALEDDATDPGTHNIVIGTLALEDDDENSFYVNNYELNEDNLGTFLIKEDIGKEGKGYAITVSDPEVEYDGKDHASNITLTKNGNPVEISKYSISFSTEAGSVAEVVNAGTYKVTVKGIGELGGTLTTENAIKITPREVTIKAADQTIKIGEQPELNAANHTAEKPVIEIDRLVPGETPSFEGSLNLASEANVNIARPYTNALSISSLTVKDNVDGKFLASNYLITNAGNYGKGTLTVTDDSGIDIEIPTGGEVTVDDKGNFSFPYDGKNHNNFFTDKKITVKYREREDEKEKTLELGINDYQVTWKKDNSEWTSTEEPWSVGAYVATITITKTDIEAIKGKFTIKTLTVKKRALTAVIKNQTIDTPESPTEFNAEGNVTISNTAEGETAVLTGKLKVNASGLQEGHIYKGAIVKENFTLTDGTGQNGFKVANYELKDEKITAGDLTVKQATNPTDPEDIIPGDGDNDWTWDPTQNAYTMTYDGLEHGITQLKVKFTDSENNVSYQVVKVTATYQPNVTPKEYVDGGYTATVSILENEYIKNGTASLKLMILKRDMTLDFHLPQSLTEGETPNWNAKTAITFTNLANPKGKEETPTIKDECRLVIENGKAVLKGYPYIVDNAATGFKMNNYTVDYKNNGQDITIDPDGDGDVEIPEIPVNPDEGGDGGDGQDPTKYYNIYDVTEYDFIDVSFSRNVVREGGSVNVYLGIPEGLDPTAVTLMFKRSLYGGWENLNTDDDGNYLINNIWTDIYVKAVVDESYIDPNPDENHIYIDLSETNDSIWLYTERKLVEEGKTAVIQAEVAKSCQNKEIRYMYKRTVLGEWKEMPKDYSINQYVVRDITTDIYVKAYFVFDKQDPTTAKNPHHVYADITATCEGLYLDATRHKVADEGDTKVFLYVKKGFETKDARYLFKRGLKGEWEDLVPGIEQNTFQVTDIEGDIYLKGMDAVYTGTEDIDGMVRVYTKDGSLFVYTAQPEEISVISMTGVTVKRTQQTGLQSYPLNQGIYVVLVGEQVFKVRVK